MKPIYIKKEVSINKISPKYKPIINDVKKQLLKFSKNIHNIYLFGSLVTGKAKSPTSDLDLIIILNRKPTIKFNNQLKALEKNLSSKYIKLFRDIGFSITHKDQVLRGKESYAWKFFLSIMSIRIYGKNLIKNNLKFSPTKKLALSLSTNYKNDLRKSKVKIKKLQGKDLNMAIQHIMKVMLRVGFYIAMEKENIWTIDKEKMAKVFIKYYPNKKKEVNKILHLIKNPNNKKEALTLIDSFGQWVLSEFYK